MTNLIYQDV